MRKAIAILSILALGFAVPTGTVFSQDPPAEPEADMVWVQVQPSGEVIPVEEKAEEESPVLDSVPVIPPQPGDPIQ